MIAAGEVHIPEDGGDTKEDRREESEADPSLLSPNGPGSREPQPSSPNCGYHQSDAGRKDAHVSE